MTVPTGEKTGGTAIIVDDGKCFDLSNTAAALLQYAEACTVRPFKVSTLATLFRTGDDAMRVPMSRFGKS